MFCAADRGTDDPDASIAYEVQSAFVLGVVRGETIFGPLELVQASIVPQLLSVETLDPVLDEIVASTSLSLTATLQDGSELDLSGATEGVFYRSSNPAIANVSADGIVSAVSSGTVLVTANYEGLVAAVQLDVVFGDDQDGDGIPDDFELANALNPGGANLARLPAALPNCNGIIQGEVPLRLGSAAILLE